MGTLERRRALLAAGALSSRVNNFEKIAEVLASVSARGNRTVLVKEPFEQNPVNYAAKFSRRGSRATLGA